MLHTAFHCFKNKKKIFKKYTPRTQTFTQKGEMRTKYTTEICSCTGDSSILHSENSSLQDFCKGNFSHKGIKQNEVTMPQGFAGHNGAKITSQTYIIE